MDSLFFIDFNSINLNIQWFYSKYSYIVHYINYDSYIYFLNKNYILYNFLIFILIIYPLISKYYLLNSLKNSINNIYLLIQKREFEFYYINEYFLYNIFFWVKKKSFIRLTFRLFEVQKENKEKYRYRKLYILLQYIDYFYIKIILDYFYSLLLRIIYFILIFTFKYLIFSIKFIILRVFYKFSLYNILFYYISSIFIIFINKSKYIIYNIFTLINYIKLEIFIYINNENNFFGGFFMYIYNSFYYKIPIFNNFKNWQLHKLPNSKTINNIFYSWINYTKNIDKKYISYNKIHIFINIYKLIKICILFLFFIKNKNKIHIFIKKYIKFKSKNNMEEYNYIYLVIGSIYYVFFDVLKSIICYIIYLIYNIIIKFRYIIIIYLLYQLGLIYIFYLSFIYYITFYLENNIYIILFHSISTIYDFYDIIIDRNILIDSNEGLCNAWKSKYEELIIKKKFYKYHTLIGKLTLLSLRNINLNSFNLTSLYDSTKILKSSVLMYTWKKFFSNIFYVIYMEITSYLSLKYYFFLYNHIKVYNIYLLYISDINIVFYIIKKLYLILIIFKIYLLMYLKYIYFYLVPYYFLLSIILKIYNIFSFLWKIYYIFYYYIIIIYYYILIVTMFYFFKFILYINIIFMNIKAVILFLYLQTIILYTIIYNIFNLIQLNIYLNIYDIYINLLVNKLIYINKYKEIIINYLRLNIFNLINYKYNSNNILGNKVIAHTQFNLEELDFIKLRKSGLNKAQMEEALIQDKLYKRYRDFFSYTNRLYIFNNLYYLYINYINNNYYWDWLYIKDFWIFNMYLKNIIFYYIIDIYIFFYLIFFFLFKKFLNINIFKANNVEYLWYDLKKNLDYKVLNHNKFFIKALYYHQKIHGKIKLSNKIYKFLDINWRLSSKNKLFDLNSLNVGFKNSYVYSKSLINNNFKNFTIEKNMYYNNFIQFYWKNLVMFNSFNNNNNFIENYEDGKNYNILNFFLSLVFSKNKNSSQIFFYFENSNKNFYWNNNYNKFFYKVNNILTFYFQKIESWLNLYNNNSLLHKDSSLVLFKDEDKNFSDMYSLNYNVNIPKYLFEFFWIGFLLYILILKFRNKFIHMYDLYSTYVRITYLKMLLINNNFMYLYDILLYWFNYIFMFDVKNMGYEQHDFKHNLSKTKRYFRRIRPSNLFIINNDPLYLLKKDYSYHLRHYNINYNVTLSSLTINYINYIKFWLNLIIFIVCYKNLYINYNNNINIYNIINIINIYNINIIKYYNYFIKKKKK